MHVKHVVCSPVEYNTEQSPLGSAVWTFYSHDTSLSLEWRCWNLQQPLVAAALFPEAAGSIVTRFYSRQLDYIRVLEASGHSVPFAHIGRRYRQICDIYTLNLPSSLLWSDHVSTGHYIEHRLRVYDWSISKFRSFAKLFLTFSALYASSIPCISLKFLRTRLLTIFRV